MYCKNVKSSTKSNPNDNASQSSHAEYSRFVWGAERNLLLIAENLIHSLSVNSWRRARDRIIQIHTDLTRNTACRNLWRMQARANERSIILSFEAATFEFVKSFSQSVRAWLFTVAGLAARDWDNRSPNEGLDLCMFLAVLWILKIWIIAHE